MAEDDSDSDIEEFSSMEQPPLIKQLKTILAEYPDDGQIIKELLQNAEDAGASEVRILYDDRCINTQVDKKSRYRKFLQGPALCFYNNAAFTDLDWKGIRMIYSSIKEEDPLKVGRFGLGFKSVFHITDNPVVLSGDRILFMDPHRSSDHVCLTIKLSKLKKWKKLNIEDFFTALQGTFGITEEILQTGRYNGTLFWFPLRSQASSLSDTLYDKGKVMDLFTAFQAEASNILIFLKQLTKVFLYSREASSHAIYMPFTVELVKNVDEVQEARISFLMKLRNLNKTILQCSISCKYLLSICTRSYERDNIIEESTTDWMVINYYKGGSMSDELKSLIQDESLGYSPFVGLAAPIGQNFKEFKGHVFCFLPLPQERTSMTGLPVHVNGYFALSQNRRHIKWPSADQVEMHLHKDKVLMWNEKLLSEVLPDVYDILIQEMINHSVLNGNPDDCIECIYATIPKADQVVDIWKTVLPQLSRRIISKPTLLTVSKFGEKSWIDYAEACFATFSQYSKLSPSVKTTVAKVLRIYDKKYVEVPLHVVKFFSQFNNSGTEVMPRHLSTILKDDSRYRSLSREEKFDLLEFFTVDCQYEILDGLELLPLNDKSFIDFVLKHRSHDQILLCSKEELELFPGLENMFVHLDQQEQWFIEHIRTIANRGQFQVQYLNAASFRSLLEEAIKNHLRQSCQPKVGPLSALKGDWIRKIWENIFSHGYEVSLFEHIPLIPVLKHGSWSDVEEIELYRLRDFLIVKQMQNMPSFNEAVYKCLELLSIKVLPSLPLWLQRSEILQYVQFSTENGVMKLLDMLYNTYEKEKVILTFNSFSAYQDRKEFIKLLAACKSWTQNSKNFIKCLKLFKESGMQEKRVSLQENLTIVGVDDFPVKFPHPYILGGYDECRLARTLGARELDQNNLVLETLQMMQNSDNDQYNFSERQAFMHYFLHNIRYFEDNTNIMNAAKCVRFLRSNLTLDISQPADLFDSSDYRLQALFEKENKFPETHHFSTESDIITLRKLGLKTYTDVTAEDLFATARVLDGWCENGREQQIMQIKAKQFMETLDEKTSLLDEKIQGISLGQKLRDMRCIIHIPTKCEGFSSVLSWFQQQQALSKPSELRLAKFSRLVGSTMPLIESRNGKLASVFSWNEDPPIDKIVQQLENVTNVYESHLKADLLPIINEIYHKLSTYEIPKLLANEKFKSLTRKAFVWNGDGFSLSNEVFLDAKTNDINLSPYLLKIPSELSYLNSFFYALGCKKEQNVDTLLETQNKIRYKYNSDKYSAQESKKDLEIILGILKRLSQEKTQLVGQQHKVLFPIRMKAGTSMLVLKPGTECTYREACSLQDINYDDSEEEIYYVHEDVSGRIAEDLGVMSHTRRLLSKTDEFEMEVVGQKEPLTRRLHNLVTDGYLDGFSVIKEIVQNADDAKANVVYFLYDERANEDARNNLLHEGLAECQGPALWAYNDAEFQENDFLNILKLNGATKEDDLEKIGKFGLGFCSVYNLTDVPSFISGSSFVILDPHSYYLGRPGVKIDLRKKENLKILTHFENQFKPFQNIFGCDLSSSKDRIQFSGTLFRFPLRTPSQAERSEISNKFYSKEECVKLLELTFRAAGNLLLFTRNIRKVTFFHLRSECNDPEEMTSLFSLSKECWEQENSSNLPTTDVLTLAANLKELGDLQSNPVRILQRISINLEAKENITWLLPLLKEQSGTKLNCSWILSWATGTDSSLQDEFVDAKWALPLCGVAVPYKENGQHLWPIPLHDLPLGFYNVGHVFCFLPLPIPTSLPVHINGCFAITSDRRHLLTITEDDKCTTRSQWNQALMKDALVNAYIYLLEGIRDSGVPLEYEYHTLWPTECLMTTIPLQTELFKRIVSTNAKVFHRNGIWKCFRECTFLDPELRNDIEIGNIALEVLSRFNKKLGNLVIDLPNQVKQCIENVSQEVLNEGLITTEQFFLHIFLPNLKDPFWSESFENTTKRDTLVQFALMIPIEKVSEALRNVECIPTEPCGTLKYPSELIDHTSTLSSLFDDNDEIFPQRKETFRNSKTVDLLKKLGMLHHTLPHNLLVGRCHSVHQLASVCGKCALDRCSRIVEYLSNKAVMHELEQDQPILISLQQIEFLPVLQKPTNWHFSWKAEENKSNILVSANICSKKHEERHIQLSSPTMLYFGFQERLVCCSELIVDEARLELSSSISTPVLRMVGVKGFDTVDIPHETVGNQLLRISEEYNRDEKIQQQICKLILEKIYNYFDECLQSTKNEETAELLNYLESFKDKQIIMIDNLMVVPIQIALDLNHNCSPELFRLPCSEWRKYEVFFKAIGIKEFFSPDEITQILIKKKQVQKNDPLSSEDTDLVYNLLLALEHSLKRADRQCNETALEIYAPDRDRILQHTKDLCMDDQDISTSSKMKLVHGKISNELAASIGIKTKRLKHLEENVVGIPWGQKEKLVTRIRSLLGAYPCDESVLKELVQNADDAGANEIHFIKDLGTHECHKILSDASKLLQGPALCVYNDRPFTEKDLQGIQSLGMGSKYSDPSKTGKYGVGFNAVYHLTDVPSFLTKGPDLENRETLCIFDPMCKFVPTATDDNPGIKCNTQSLRQCYPDVLKGYHERDDTFFKSNCGTMFRFPLRNKEMSEVSLISQEEISVKRLNEILKDSKPEIYESLLFLRHISKIKISDITSGTLKEEYAVEAIISEIDKRRRDEFFQYVEESIKKNQTNEKLSLLQIHPREVGYTIIVKDSDKTMKVFYVLQRIGFDDDSKIPSSISYAAKEHLIGQVPLAGVAASLPSDERLTLEAWKKRTSETPFGLLQENRLRKSGRAFCFLPLPLQTGLPVHVNGNFMLDHESRRSLWKGDKGYCYDWNHALLGDTVAHAYVSCLSFMKVHIFKEAYEQQSLNMAKLDLFSSYFPTLKDINDDYWKALLKYVYQVISDREIEIFPSLKEREEHHVELKWFPLRRSLDYFPSFFDNLSNEYKNLIAPLQAMGMKIIKSPRRVQDAISSTGLRLHQICPDTVFSFLLSYQESHEDSCKIEFDLHISRTNLMSTKNALDLINFLNTGQELYKNLQGLPLLVRNDEFLGCFDCENPLFLSQYCELLQRSRELFVHKDLVNIFDTVDFRKSGLFKDLQIQDLANYLPNSIDPLVFASGEVIEWSLESPEAPNAVWVAMFWTMLHENSMGKEESGKEFFDQVLFKQNLKVFDNWSLLPCKRKPTEDNNKIKRFLIPIRKRFTVLNYYCSSACTDFDRAIMKIRFPCIDTDIFPKFTSFAMKKMVSTVENPLDFLKCLEYHVDELKKCNLSSDECNALLIYLSENLMLLRKESEDTWLRDIVRSLPIHVTYDGKHTGFSQTDKVLVLPDEMPQDGIAEWVTATNHILLIQNGKLRNLHAFLGFSYEETIDIYCNKIARSFLKLPEISHLSHLEFIRDRLFHLHGSYNSAQEFNNKQMILLGILKEVPFLKCTDGRYKQVKDLFDPINKVFQVMCKETQFPPDCYRLGDWREFFVLLGLMTELSDEHLLKFARDIAREGEINVRNTVTKAKRLLKYFWNGKIDWGKKTLKTLSKIKFIPPHRTFPTNIEIFKQPNDCDRLICFSGSVSSEFELLCWTTLDLLSIKFCPNSHRAHDLAAVLGVYDAPPVEKVIQHTQHVCDAQSAKCSESRPSDLDASHFRTIMQIIYTFLSENRDKDPEMRQKLQNTPVIFIDEKKTLVKSTQVIINLIEADTIEPYLYKAPSFYGQFKELFVYLGASREVQIIHYARILTMIKNDVQDEILYAKEFDFLRQAMSNMVKRLPCTNGTELELDIDILYFPNRRRKLCNAKMLIVSDNSYFENRLSSESDIDYFMGFENLRIDVKDVKQTILYLPKRLRPSLLTEVVEEEIDMSEMNEIQSAKARKIGMFLQSSHFIQGVLRLVKHAIKDKFSEHMETKLIHDLQNVGVKEVTGLNTYLKFKGRRIEASKAKKKCFMAKAEIENKAQYTIYFQNTGQPENSIDDLLEDEGDLLDFIHACTGGILHDETTFKLMYAIIRCFSSPQQIQVKLDEKKIDQYNLTQLSPTTMFPVPGTYVPKEFHPFLEQGFSFFEEHEYQYLALEVEDPDIEMDVEQQEINNPVFIYVHIIEPVRSDDANGSEIKRIYLVDIGDSEQGNTVVYGLQLYKFKRKKENKNRDVIPADAASVESFSLDETCRKIRSILRDAWTLSEKERRLVIKRLWLKWHPDKNKGQEDYCQKVFNYINATIIKLESGQPLDNYNDSRFTEEGNFTSTRYETMSSRMRQRGSQYSRAYDEYYEYFAQAHGRSQASSSSFHGGATSFSVPLPTEAKRWMDQAKRDLLAAEAFFPSAKCVAAFNWICYTCHQATEKALKAGGFAVDANSVPRKSHQLTQIAAGLSHTIRELARDMQNCVGQHTRMRYPDSILNRRIPSESYTEEHATETLRIAKRVLDLVDQEYLNSTGFH